MKAVPRVNELLISFPNSPTKMLPVFEATKNGLANKAKVAPAIPITPMNKYKGERPFFGTKKETNGKKSTKQSHKKAINNPVQKTVLRLS